MNEKTPSEKLKIYSVEVSEDLKITEMTIQDKSFEIPQRKHYWVSKFILESQELHRLQREKKNLEKEVIKAQTTNDIPVSMSQASLKKAISNTKPIQEIDKLIEDQELLVEYLGKVEKIFSYITNDIKNIIDVMVLQVS